ncbi:MULTISPECIES: MIP/aquaporin family protein [Bacillales]|uniref:MIP/aquaporin family protein n=1 Tax=Lysinibacillus louembei TaxID=1470088 RepID=A0ABZ0RQJ0_9BACI|nr:MULTISPECIES: MIP/aquaporin family protein [Bacillales]MCT6926261.1 aquaporin family protein [Metasolibacillus sp.]MCT6942498.1 aquaporin family protein [Metasolibacillus sp.]WPK10497.1 MIP/aquaporin family protein [Lysinibacillus louembei]
MSTFTAELIGTMILILFGGGVVAGALLYKSKGNGGGWVVITFAWGLAVAMAAYAVGGISGAHLNPALTIALATIGDFPWADVPLYIVAQMLGAMLGATLVYFMYLPHWKGTEDADAKLAVFSTMPAIKHPLSNLISEIIGTFILVLGILALGTNTITDGLNPFLVGMLIVVIGMALGGPTGYAINPARDLGPRIAHFFLPIPGKRDSGWSYAWVPVVGPIIGGAFGALFFQQLFEGKNSVAFWVLAVVIVAIFAGAQATVKNVRD